MAQDKCTGFDQKAKRLTAHEVYQLTVETLQTHFPLAMADKHYLAQDIWDVLVAAVVERTTVEGASTLLEQPPSANAVRNVLRGVLPDAAEIAQLEAQLNETLVAHCRRSCWTGRWRVPSTSPRSPTMGSMTKTTKGGVAGEPSMAPPTSTATPRSTS